MSEQTRSKSDKATRDDCSWGQFTPQRLNEVKKAAQRLARRLDVDADDLEQETLIYLSVRPNLSPYWAAKSVSDAMRVAASQDRSMNMPLNDWEGIA